MQVVGRQNHSYKIISEIDPIIFRAYDIRGVYPQQLCIDTAYTIGLAIGTELSVSNQHQIICGRDGRISSPQLSCALQQGLHDSGCEVIDVGMVPTPILYFATHHLNIHAAVMLTGSHNPAQYNGMKIILNGATLIAADIEQLYQRIVSGQFNFGKGSYQQQQPIVTAYIEKIASHIKLPRRIKLVIDCGNGVAGNMVKQLFTSLGCEVIELYCEVDGNFPNHHPDPTIIDNLKDLISAVAEHQADLGIAFDGDADRLGVVTNTGKVIWPDRLMILFAIDILTRNPGARIIFDVKCSDNLAKAISNNGGEAIMCATGHSILKSHLHKLGGLLAGEMSGHIFFKERWYGFDDGMYSAARLLEIIAAQPLSVDEFFATVPDSVNTPELKIPLAEEQKFLFIEQLKQHANFDNAAINLLDGLRVTFDKGWGLVRASNTTPCLVARFEANNEYELQQIQNIFKQQLLKINPHLQLPF